MTAARRSGRRPAGSGTREGILAAARQSFGTAGYAGTTIRAVARDAGVDPALVHHFFGSKDQLFGAALELPYDPALLVTSLLAGGVEGLGERVVRTFLGIWDATPGQGPMLALLRSAVGSEPSAKTLRDVLDHAILTPLTAEAARDQAPLRACLIGTQMIGLAMARYVVRLEPLASAGPDELAPTLGHTIDRYLTDPLPGTAAPT